MRRVWSGLEQLDRFRKPKPRLLGLNDRHPGVGRKTSREPAFTTSAPAALARAFATEAASSAKTR